MAKTKLMNKKKSTVVKKKPATKPKASPASKEKKVVTGKKALASVKSNKKTNPNMGPVSKQTPVTEPLLSDHALDEYFEEFIPDKSVGKENEEWTLKDEEFYNSLI